jgi:hypothetical protein
MSTDQMLATAKPRPRRQPQPGELIFEFYVERTHRFYRRELRDHGEHGVEAQFFEAPNDLRIAHRFDPFNFPGADCRKLAIEWATKWRGEIEAGRVSE